MVMMTGEIEYNDLYYPQRQRIVLNKTPGAEQDFTGYLQEEDLPQNFPFTAHIVLAIFIIIVSIVIMNLLFGMAVSDVQVRQIILVYSIILLEHFILVCFLTVRHSDE